MVEEEQRSEWENPFQVGGRVRGAALADRGYEVELVLAAMLGGERLLVTGPRRMGKSVVLGAAAERVEAEGGAVVWAELGTASSLLEAVDRVLAGVAGVEAWRGRLMGWARALAPVVQLGFDESGGPVLRVGSDVRPRRAEAERRLLERVLDRIEAEAREASAGESDSAPVVVVLDDFDRLTELGGEPLEWLIRDRMRDNEATAYVCAVSGEDRVGELLQPTRAFYRAFERVRIGLIDPAHLGGWIDDRLTVSGVAASGVGSAVVTAVGPGTHDVVRAARTLWYQRRAVGRAEAGDVAEAVSEIVVQCDPAYRRSWSELTPLQQRLLRAVAEGARELHSTRTRERYQLGASSSVTTALTSLESRSFLVRRDGELAFDDPYQREWVLGIRRGS